MRSTTLITENPATNIPPSKPLAFQSSSGKHLGAIFTTVALAHVTVIALLLSHFGWFGSSPEVASIASAEQSGIVIPVTLESTLKPEPEPERESEREPEREPEAEPPEPEPKAEPIPELVLTVPPPELKPDQQAEPANSTQTQTKPEPTRARQASNANAGKTAGPAQQSAATVAFPLTPAHVDPNYLHRPNPVYPALSRRLREEGTVLLRVNLDAQGIVLDIHIEKSSRFQRLDQAALEAVKQWRFVPAKRGQVAMPSSALVPIEFKQQ
jgi:protein TonB